MDACEPRLRRRGFFLHSSETANRTPANTKTPKDSSVRVRFTRQPQRSRARWPARAAATSAADRHRTDHTEPKAGPRSDQGA